MKPKRLLAALLTLILTCSFVTSASAASCGEYVDWTWKNGTSSLSVQMFPSAYDFYDNIYAVYQSWNDISSAVSIDGFTYYADGTNQNKDIQIVGAALTGTTLANTSIYSKNIGKSLKTPKRVTPAQFKQPRLVVFSMASTKFRQLPLPAWDLLKLRHPIID